MPGITERLGSDVLVVQGAVGTYLAQKGFEGNVCSLNLEEPDECAARLNLTPVTVDTELNLVLSNSFGFGGTNSALVLRKV